MLLKMLHISDPHGEREVMANLDVLARAETGCAAVLCTGDVTSATLRQLPSSWNNWPQPTKLLVPGNHDTADTFMALSGWVRHAPWAIAVADLLFVGLDTAEGFDTTLEQLEHLFRAGRAAESVGVVLLSHRWPVGPHVTQLGVGLAAIFGDRPTLYCHGHDHPNTFNGSLWTDAEELGPFICTRSQVCSCARGVRGLAHRITWATRRFFCEPVVA